MAKEHISYQTRQRKRLVSFLEENADRQFTSAELTAVLCGENCSGKSTVYRQLQQLTEEGVLRRFRGENAQSVLYQYVGKHHECERHFHLKCTGCGTLVHLDCDHMQTLQQHILADHDFFVDPAVTVLYGICHACAKRSGGTSV